MTCLKEREKKKNQKEQEKENQQPHPRARGRRVSVASADEIESRPSAYVRGILCHDLMVAANKIGMSAAEVNAWQRYMEEVDWRFTTGTRINFLNFRRSLRMWHRTEERMMLERGESGEVREREARQLNTKTAALVRQSKNDPSFWALCRESCANCGEHGCTCGVAIPPDRQLPRPHRPEECPEFDARKEAV